MASYYSSDMDDEGAEESAKGLDKHDPGTETTLVPKSFLGGDPKPGDICKVEVVRTHEGEVEIKYLPHDEESDDTGMDKDQAAEKLDAMATQSGEGSEGGY